MSVTVSSANITWKSFLFVARLYSSHLVGNFDDEVTPEEMEDEEGGEEEVEDIVGREHCQDLSRFYAAAYLSLYLVSLHSQICDKEFTNP